MQTKIRPVILSGGAGTRLWPMSRSSSPKQLLKLMGPATMLQMTVARAADPRRFGTPVIVANEAHAAEIERQLQSEGLTTHSLVLEPDGRNTAAAICLGALMAAPGEILLVMPSDHLIGETEAFMAAVELAARAAQEGWLVTFGIQPTRGESGYGYIRRGEDLSAGVHRVDHFVEKPPPDVAARLASDSHYYWNAGIFMFRADTFLSALEKHAPDILRSVETSLRAGTAAEGRFRPDEAAFKEAPSISVDHAIMEKADHVAVVPVSMDWSDVGSWDAVYEVVEKNSDGSGTSGEVIEIGCRGSLIHTTGPLVTAIGVEDLIIVATDDAVLVMPRGQSQRVREAIDACRAADRKDLL